LPGPALVGPETATVLPRDGGRAAVTLQRRLDIAADFGSNEARMEETRERRP